MKKFRRVDMTDLPGYGYPAFEKTVADGLRKGSTPPTISRWIFDENVNVMIPPIEDSDHIDTEKARELDIPYFRRWMQGGGTGFFKEDKMGVGWAAFSEWDGTLTELIDGAGETLAAVLRDNGLENTEYDPLGDIEVKTEDPEQPNTKVGANGAAYKDGIWTVMWSIILKEMDPSVFEKVNQVINLPKEKFVDKKAKDVTSRLLPLSTLGDFDFDGLMDDTINGIMDFLGTDVEKRELTREEKSNYKKHGRYFKERKNFYDYSTKRMFEKAPKEYKKGMRAWKAEKLVKVSLVIDEEDKIHDCMFTGDLYMKSFEESEKKLSNSIKGINTTDENALKEAVRRVYESEDFEAPYMEFEDFTRPVFLAIEAAAS